MIFVMGLSFQTGRPARYGYYPSEKADIYSPFRGFFSLSIYGTLGFLAFFLAVSFIWAKLYYDSFKFELAAKGLKIEKGVIWKHYVTIPYERIQNVDIYRGPLVRLLGLSDLHVQTAGMSGAMITEGRIPALFPKDAEELREKLVDKIGRGQGL